MPSAAVARARDALSGTSRDSFLVRGPTVVQGSATWWHSRRLEDKAGRRFDRSPGTVSYKRVLPPKSVRIRMPSYYLSEDLARFGELSRTTPELFELFRKWYAATMEKGAL